MNYTNLIVLTAYITLIAQLSEGNPTIMIMAIASMVMYGIVERKTKKMSQ